MAVNETHLTVLNCPVVGCHAIIFPQNSEKGLWEFHETKLELKNGVEIYKNSPCMPQARITADAGRGKSGDDN